jgi:outer membrane receptor protein involved in Fe transport
MAMALLMGAQAVEAQTETPPAKPAKDAGSDPVEADIVITGSRLARSGFNSPTPVSVVGQENMQSLGISDLGQAVNQVPAFRPSATPAYTPIGDGIGTTQFDLRGLTPVRTLILIDGRRVVPSTPQGTVDIGLLPTLLVGRTEVVTGGASAAYGADAVAGVVNFIIDSKFTGIKGEIQQGISEQGYDRRFHVGLAGGTSFAGGRGHVVASIEYNKDKGLPDCYHFDWCSEEWSLPSNPGGAGANGFPAFNLLPAIRTPASEGGVVVNGPLRGMNFNNDGSVGTFTFGQLQSASQMYGGDGFGHTFLYKDFLQKVPVERGSAFIHAEFEASSALNLFAEFSYGEVRAHEKGSYNNSRTIDFSTITIRRDNAFLPAAALARMNDPNGDGNTADAVNSFTMARLNEDFEADVQAKRTSWRGVGGFKFDFGGSWKLDGYYQHGFTRNRTDWKNFALQENWRLAIDAVRAPSGQIVCRSSLGGEPYAASDPRFGCQPLNIFGRDQFSQASYNYVNANAWQVIDFTQDAGGLNLQGDLFQGWAGPIAAAVGVEIRRDAADGTSDMLSQANAFRKINAQPLNGTIVTKEVYGEVDVPLLRDSSLGRLLSVNGAIRYADYKRSSTTTSSKVNATTWKVGAVYEPTDWLRLRGTRSRDVRAPNTTELFASQVTTSVVVTDVIGPGGGTGQTFIANDIAQGGINVRPEKADTSTFGIVLRPQDGWFRNLRFSVDYFDIKLRDAIARLGAGNLLSRCNFGVQEFCELVVRDPTTQAVLAVNDPYVNFGTLKTNGLDFEVDYLVPFDSDRSLRFGVTATRTFHLKTTDVAGTIDRAGMHGVTQGTLAVPKWRVNGTITYKGGPLTLAVQGNFIPAGDYQHNNYITPDDPGYSINLPRSLNANHVSARAYADLIATYDILRDEDGLKFSMFAGIYNITNVDPPPLPAAGTTTNPQYYDTVGRRFAIGARFRY